MNVQTECEYVRTRIAPKSQNRDLSSTLNGVYTFLLRDPQISWEREIPLLYL